ncbi:MAG: lipopolysaccharide heptosyltransferase I [Phycisphaerae bacterium]
MTPLAERKFRRILLIKPSSPGDIIHALPVLHGLRRRYPQARIEWLVATAFADLVAVDPRLGAVVRFDRRRFRLVGRSPRVTLDFLSFLRDLRSRDYDLVIDLQGLFRSGFMAFATRARVRIGFAAARELAWIFYTHRMTATRQDVHAADRNYAVAALLGFADVAMDFSPALTGEDRQAAARLRHASGIGGDGRYVVLVPATRWETKCWPASRFGWLAAAIRRAHGIPSILVGGADDRARGDDAAAASDGAAANLCGRTTLRELAALIEQATVVVTADSTPMHLAAAMGRPLVALFGPTNPARTGPYCRASDVLRVEDLDCSPCYYRRLTQCPHGHACMEQLTVETVAAEVSRRLADEAAPTAETVRP